MDTNLLLEAENVTEVLLCTRCKINPRARYKSGNNTWCKQCNNESATAYYTDLRINGINKNGKTYEHALLVRYKNTAKRRNRQFNLTDEQAIAIMHQPCHYCKLPKSMGIDRVDSNSNYEIETVVPCCSQCNRAKHKQTDEQYKAWLQGVVERFIAEQIKSG